MNTRITQLPADRLQADPPQKQRIECPVCRKRFYTRLKPGKLAQCPACAELVCSVLIRVTGASSQRPARPVVVRELGR